MAEHDLLHGWSAASRELFDRLVEKQCTLLESFSLPELRHKLNRHMMLARMPHRKVSVTPEGELSSGAKLHATLVALQMCEAEAIKRNAEAAARSSAWLARARRHQQETLHFRAAPVPKAASAKRVAEPPAAEHGVKEEEPAAAAPAGKRARRDDDAASAVAAAATAAAAAAAAAQKAAAAASAAATAASAAAAAAADAARHAQRALDCL